MARVLYLAQAHRLRFSAIAFLLADGSEDQDSQESQE